MGDRSNSHQLSSSFPYQQSQHINFPQDPRTVSWTHDCPSLFQAYLDWFCELHSSIYECIHFISVRFGTNLSWKPIGMPLNRGRPIHHHPVQHHGKMSRNKTSWLFAACASRWVLFDFPRKRTTGTQGSNCSLPASAPSCRETAICSCGAISTCRTIKIP